MRLFGFSLTAKGVFLLPAASHIHPRPIKFISHVVKCVPLLLYFKITQFIDTPFHNSSISRSNNIRKLIY